MQSLANPMYVHFLAQNQFLEDQRFLRYLEYLEYWRRPENAKYIVYPNCLHMLTLLKQPNFRQEICKVEVAKMVMDDYYAKWAGDVSVDAAGAADDAGVGQAQSTGGSGGSGPGGIASGQFPPGISEQTAGSVA